MFKLAAGFNAGLPYCSSSLNAGCFKLEKDEIRPAELGLELDSAKSFVDARVDALAVDGGLLK